MLAQNQREARGAALVLLDNIFMAPVHVGGAQSDNENEDPNDEHDDRAPEAIGAERGEMWARVVGHVCLPDRRSLGDANEKTRKSGPRRANAAAQMVRWLTDRQRPQFSARSA